MWPSDAIARAHARYAACEMHSGFAALRSRCPCNIRRRAEPRQLGEEVQHDVERIDAIWTTLRERFGGGGPYLFGRTPTIADAFYAPVATRLRTYAITVSEAAQRYADALLADAAFREWEAAGLEETWALEQSDSA